MGFGVMFALLERTLFKYRSTYPITEVSESIWPCRAQSRNYAWL